MGLFIGFILLIVFLILVLGLNGYNVGFHRALLRNLPGTVTKKRMETSEATMNIGRIISLIAAIVLIKIGGNWLLGVSGIWKIMGPLGLLNFDPITSTIQGYGDAIIGVFFWCCAFGLGSYIGAWNARRSPTTWGGVLGDEE